MTPLCAHRDCDNRAMVNHDLCAVHAKRNLVALNRGITRRARRRTPAADTAEKPEGRA